MSDPEPTPDPRSFAGANRVAWYLRTPCAPNRVAPPLDMTPPPEPRVSRHTNYILRARLLAARARDEEAAACELALVYADESQARRLHERLDSLRHLLARQRLDEEAEAASPAQPAERSGSLQVPEPGGWRDRGDGGARATDGGRASRGGPDEDQPSPALERKDG